MIEILRSNLDAFKNLFFEYETRLIPLIAEEDLIRIIKSLHDEESLNYFRYCHNVFIESLREHIYGDGMRPKFIALKDTLSLLGIPIIGMVRAMAVCRYYEFLFSDQISTTRAAYDAILDSKKRINKLKFGEKFIEKIDEPKYEDLAKKYEAYLNASNYVNAVLERVDALVGQNNLAREVWAEGIEQALPNARRHYQETVGKMNMPFLCPYCDRYEPAPARTQGRGIRAAHCGRSECKKAYDKNKESKKNRSNKPDGWVKGKRAPCQADGCGETRVLHKALMVCQQCFKRSLREA